MPLRRIAVLGITGSIGKTAVNGCRVFPDRISIVAASCNTNVEAAVGICIEMGIRNLCITSSDALLQMDRRLIPDSIRIWSSLSSMLSEVDLDMVLNGISGSDGLAASFDAIHAGRDLALANKETIVLGGSLVFREAQKHGVDIIPVDSEHSAIDELIRVHGRENTDKLVITASGGPFRDCSADELANVTVQDAVRHPTWKMGPKISIDSSTLANKGLEVIEAHYLFGFSADRIEVVVHPQSVVHSMVRLKSGQIYAQMSPPDMVFPIMRALCWPNVDRQVGNALDFSELDLTFRKLDSERFPLVSDAFECVRLEGSYPIVYNIADEVAVSSFMQGHIGFTQIRSEIRKMLDKDWTRTPECLDDILEVKNTVLEMMKA